MGYGYSQGLIAANKHGNARSLGVALGRVCIAKGIGVSTVADAFGVSRMTVYNWFKGATNPRPDLRDEVQRYIKTHASLTKKK